MSTNYKNLVFQGGGVKGIAYAGAVETLEEQNILPQIQRVAGTSAGSIVAALLALRYSAADIKNIVGQTNFASFEDHKNPARILLKYGLYKGDAFLDWMVSQIENVDLAKNGLTKKLNGQSTFKDFKEAGCRDLHVFTTDLNAKNVVKLSFEDHPNVIVAEAIRASMSIPLFFMAWKFSNGLPNDHIYVDGGMVYAYALTAFDINKQPNMETLGFHLDNLSGTTPPNDLNYDHIIKYIEDLFETMLVGQKLAFSNNPSMLERTVKIDDFGIKPTDFNLSDADKTRLYNSGKKYAAAFLTKNKASV